MIWTLTSVMLAVSNTSPVSNLTIIGRLDLLREQFGTVVIPPCVREELGRHPHPGTRELLERSIHDGWVRVVPLAGAVPHELSSSLHAGEAEALALALEIKATLVLLDETAARQKALELGLAFTGVLGVLLKARREGRIPSLKTEIQRLRDEARFFVTRALENRLLASIGE